MVQPDLIRYNGLNSKLYIILYKNLKSLVISCNLFTLYTKIENCVSKTYIKDF